MLAQCRTSVADDGATILANIKSVYCIDWVYVQVSVSRRLTHIVNMSCGLLNSFYEGINVFQHGGHLERSPLQIKTCP